MLRALPASSTLVTALRSLVVVLGDQLDLEAAAFDGFDASQDLVWMAEVAEESTQVWSSKQRTAVFLAAMRHFAVALQAAGRPVRYRRLDDVTNQGTLAAELHAAIQAVRPRQLVLTAPGEWRVLQSIKTVCSAAGVPLELREDRHFYISMRDFAQYAEGRQTLRLEFFYRDMRRRHGVLMEGGEPRGGRWNFDADNRQSFGRAGPGNLPPRATFPPDALTREVIDMVEARFATHPGSLGSFAWPVTREQALVALHDFVARRLPAFGRYQDALWAGEAWGYHSQLSAALNLKLLNPREVVQAAEAACVTGHVPLGSAEGFIRQILGWREYVRGIYWTRMPQYAESNALDAGHDLPAWYWTARTDFTCLRDAIGQTLEHGYAHHIQRLMVTGLFALLFGVRPRRVHEWYLAVYVDAVEWVELPNTYGMSQYADGGYMASKPYIATGKYIERMSNLCEGCRYDPALKTGEAACPFTTLYWDFLMRHEILLAGNQRMSLQVKNLKRLSDADRRAVTARAAAIRRGEVGGEKDGSRGLPPVECSAPKSRDFS